MPLAARPRPLLAHTFLRGIGLLATWLIGTTLAATPASDHLTAGWRELNALSPQAAAAHFEAALRQQPGSRAAAYGLAMATLHQPPVTAARVRQAQSQFRALTQAPPDDPQAQAAYFQLGRIAELYAELVPGGDAATPYRALHALAPASFHGQYAWLRLAAIELTPWSGDPANLLPRLRSRVAEAESALSDPRLQRNFARLVAYLAHSYPDGEPLALQSAVAGTAIGYGRWDIQEEMLALVVRLAERAGDDELLAATIAVYVERFPRGPRRTVVELRRPTEGSP
jgi:hypothetical protein